MCGELMWYVVQVAVGSENKVRDMITRAAEVHEAATSTKVLDECFVPKYQAQQKFRGEYRFVERNLLPGYVIVVTNNVHELNEVLYRIIPFTKILGNHAGFAPLSRAEMAFLNSMTTEQHRLVDMSHAVKEGDSITVIDGPLVGREGWIKSINRRKGTCRIETTLFGRTINVEIGLAVLAKSEQTA